MLFFVGQAKRVPGVGGGEAHAYDQGLMSNVQVDAELIEGLPVVALDFPAGAGYEIHTKALVELVGPLAFFGTCAQGHKMVRFHGGATACTFFVPSNVAGHDRMQLIFHQPPPAECALMLLLKTPKDRKGMN